jgi:hypothetical protein
MAFIFFGRFNVIVSTGSSLSTMINSYFPIGFSFQSRALRIADNPKSSPTALHSVVFPNHCASPVFPSAPQSACGRPERCRGTSPRRNSIHKPGGASPALQLKLRFVHPPPLRTQQDFRSRGRVAGPRNQRSSLDEARAPLARGRNPPHMPGSCPWNHPATIAFPGCSRAPSALLLARLALLHTLVTEHAAARSRSRRSVRHSTSSKRSHSP